MSQYTSNQIIRLDQQLKSLARSMEMIAVGLGSNFSALQGQMDDIIKSLHSDLKSFDQEADLAALLGRGPRAAVLRCVYGEGTTAEEMIASKLPKQRTDVNDLQRRDRLSPAEVAKLLLSHVAIGNRNGHYYWTNSDGTELNELFQRTQIDEAVRSPFLTREGVYRGQIGDDRYYGSMNYTLVVRFKANDKSEDESLVFIPSNSTQCHYLTYCPLEETWVMHTDPSYIDEPAVISRIIDLLNGVKLPTTAPELEDTYRTIYSAAFEAGIPVEDAGNNGAEWSTPRDYPDSKSEWLDSPIIRVSRTRDQRNTFLSLRVGNDVLTISRLGPISEDPNARKMVGGGEKVHYRFDTGTQCLNYRTPEDWRDRLPVPIRLAIINCYEKAIKQYVNAHSVANNEMA